MNAKEFLKHNTDVLDDIRNRIKAASPELSGRIAFDGHEGGAAPVGVGAEVNGLGEDEDLL